MGTKSDVINAIYQAFGEGDVDTILSHVTDDVDWAPEAAGTVAPWWGQYKGKEEVPGFFRALAEAVEVTGVVLTKLDGSAKGGIVLAIQSELGIPVKLVGLGETEDDLVAFDPDDFVDALFA